MSGFTRTKRVTDPLNDRVKARIVGQELLNPGYISSGSEHSAHADDDDVVSQSLSDLFYGSVVVTDDIAANELKENVANEESKCSPYDLDKAIRDLKGVLNEKGDSYRNLVKAKVCKGIELFSCPTNKSSYRRNVMAFLINLGYNAAICKTKWESSGGLTGGNYEFIDIVGSDSSRYFVELDFAAEFQIARPTCSYEKLLKMLPRVFVGKADELKKILKIMADAAKRSLKSKDLIIPPWRKHRYMQNKWLAPYKRTTNIFPTSFSTPSNKKFIVKCRAVGFEANVDYGRSLLPTATCTR